jgi:uncharacterized membrane protein
MQNTPAASPKVLRRTAYFTLAGATIWIVLIFLAPFLRSVNSRGQVLFYAIFSPTCHQIDSRCFLFFGFPLAVCARCLGVYLGILLGTLLFSLKMASSPPLPQTRTFVLLTCPLVLDGLGNLFGIWYSPNLFRLGVGALWGGILPYYFIPGLADALSKKPRTIHLK